MQSVNKMEVHEPSQVDIIAEISDDDLFDYLVGDSHSENGHSGDDMQDCLVDKPFLPPFQIKVDQSPEMSTFDQPRRVSACHDEKSRQTKAKEKRQYNRGSTRRRVPLTDKQETLLDNSILYSPDWGHMPPRLQRRHTVATVVNGSWDSAESSVSASNLRRPIDDFQDDEELDLETRYRQGLQRFLTTMQRSEQTRQQIIHQRRHLSCIYSQREGKDDLLSDRGDGRSEEYHLSRSALISSIYSELSSGQSDYMDDDDEY